MNYSMRLVFKKPESMPLMVKISCSLISTQYQHITDRQTDAPPITNKR